MPTNTMPACGSAMMETVTAALPGELRSNRKAMPSARRMPSTVRVMNSHAPASCRNQSGAGEIETMSFATFTPALFT